MARKKYIDFKAYLADVPPDPCRRIRAIRKMVKAQIPNSVEVISYNMPAFKTNKVFMYVAAFKGHIGVYPPVKKDLRLLEALQPYSNEKGNLRFNLDEPLPTALLVRVVKALAAQIDR